MPFGPESFVVEEQRIHEAYARRRTGDLYSPFSRAQLLCCKSASDISSACLSSRKLGRWIARKSWKLAQRRGPARWHPLGRDPLRKYAVSNLSMRARKIYSASICLPTDPFGVTRMSPNFAGSRRDEIVIL